MKSIFTSAVQSDLLREFRLQFTFRYSKEGKTAKKGYFVQNTTLPFSSPKKALKKVVCLLVYKKCASDVI